MQTPENIEYNQLLVCDNTYNLKQFQKNNSINLEDVHILQSTTLPHIASKADSSIYNSIALTDLVTPNSMLEGSIPTQDAQQLTLLIESMLDSGRNPTLYIAGGSGIGYYLLQLINTGVIPNNFKIIRDVSTSHREQLESNSLFPTVIDDLVAFFQESREEIIYNSLSKTLITPTHKESISITAAISHFNRPKYLKSSLESLLQQTRLPDQILIGDDGSTEPDAIKFLNQIEETDYAVPVKVLRLENRYLGAVRNSEWQSAKTDYIFFMDDDDIAMPDELETMEYAATCTQADIITCQMEYFEDENDIGRNEPPRWLPIGGAIDVGFFVNLFGPANTLIKRSVLEELDGFTEDYGTGHEDWEFFARACLAGYKLELIPKPLFWCRWQPGKSMLHSGNAYHDLNKNLRPYLTNDGFFSRDVLNLAFGMNMNQETGIGYNVGLWKKRDKLSIKIPCNQKAMPKKDNS